MPYDFDDAGPYRGPPRRPYTKPAHPTDLAAIVTLVQVAAIFLTDGPGASFTASQLLTQANAIAGGDLVLDARDVAIVLPYMPGFKRQPGKRYSLK
jgi:hypothetical protein